jgi:short-subunit dehydrogenase
MTTALVTGPTAGIGLAFARRLAADGHDLVLVARDQERLDAVAAELRAAYGREVETMSADLADRAATQRVADRLADASRPVEILVNNAGFGLGRGFLSTDVADEERQLDVHCRAVLVLTHAAARAMRERRSGTIINVSSVAGFAALGTYSAVKAWSTAFSEAVAGQLAPYGVRVTAVCPGFVRTEFHGRGGMDMSAMPDLAWLDADDLVDEALADVAKGKVVSVPSKRFKTVVLALRHLPRPLVRKGSGAVQRRRTSS